MMADIFSDLALSRYVVTSIDLKSRAELYGQKVTGGELGLDFEFAANSEAKNKYQLELTVTVNANDRAFEEHGVRVSATIVGFFVWNAQDSETAPTDDDVQVVMVNGLSILYGTLRPIITQLVQQAGRHRFSLPTVDMRKFIDDFARNNAVDIDSLSVAQLREIAEVRGVNLAGKRRRDDILEAVRAHVSSQ